MLAWRSAEVAGLAAAAMLLFALSVRRYLEYEAACTRGSSATGGRS